MKQWLLLGVNPVKLFPISRFGPQTQTMDHETKTEIERLHKQIATQNKRITKLENQREELLNRISDLEQIVEPDPGSTDYKQLTRDQKVHQIRKKLVSLAKNNHGHARLQYTDIQRLFNGHPSPGHVYDLMERAAGINGFFYDRAGKNGQKRIRVETDAVNELERFHDANKATTETTA